MKRALTFLFLLSVQFLTYAQNSITGRVTDKDTKEPLFGAIVYIADLKMGTVTDTAGMFYFTNVSPGKFLLQVKLIGYASQVITANTTDTKTLEVFLSQSAGELQEVVVTGVSKGTEIRRSAIPIVAVDQDYLASNVASNVIDAITKVPGITAVTTGPNISKPFIRGLGYNRILTLYDGVRQEGQQWGDEHGIEVDQFGIERIEVIKGPASLSYGSDALAGVVNLIPTAPAPEGKMLGDITTEYGTNNREIGVSGMLEGTKKGVDWIFRVSHKQAMDYYDKYDGRVFNTAFSETDASGSVGVHRNWGFFHLSFAAFSDLQEIPDGSRDSATRQFTRQISEIDTTRAIVTKQELNTYKIEPLHQHVQHYRVYTDNSFRLGPAGSLDVNVGYQYSQRQEFDHPVLYTIPGLYLQLHTVNFDVKYNITEKKGWNFSTGVNGMYQMNTVTKGTDFVIPSYQQFDIGAFAVVKRSFGKFDLEAGLRYDVRDFDNSQLYIKPTQRMGLICRYQVRIRLAGKNYFRVCIPYTRGLPVAWVLPTILPISFALNSVLVVAIGHRILLKFRPMVFIPVPMFTKLATLHLSLSLVLNRIWVFHTLPNMWCSWPIFFITISKITFTTRNRILPLWQVMKLSNLNKPERSCMVAR